MLGGIKDAIDERVVGWNFVALEPEEHVGLAAHGADFDHLFEPEEVRRHAAINGISERLVSLMKCFDDGGGVDARCRAECIAADHRIIRRNNGVRGRRDFFAILPEPREVLVNDAHQAQIY